MRLLGKGLQYKLKTTGKCTHNIHVQQLIDELLPLPSVPLQYCIMGLRQGRM
jgi:hypothetical protein